jgi:hypothetical protein
VPIAARTSVAVNRRAPAGAQPPPPAREAELGLARPAAADREAIQSASTGWCASSPPGREAELGLAGHRRAHVRRGQSASTGWRDPSPLGLARPAAADREAIQSASTGWCASSPPGREAEHWLARPICVARISGKGGVRFFGTHTIAARTSVAVNRRAAAGAQPPPPGREAEHWLARRAAADREAIQSESTGWCASSPPGREAELGLARPIAARTSVAVNRRAPAGATRRRSG